MAGKTIGKDSIAVTRGSGNVFADLGLPNAEEELVKAKIVTLLRGLVADAGLSQSAAAARLGIAQPDVSNLLRGRLKGFSLERLLGFLQALGRDVEIKVKQPQIEREGRLVLEVA